MSRSIATIRKSPTARKLGIGLLAASTLGGGGAVFANQANAAGPSGPDTCLYGFVWRDGRAGDHVCVTPATRSATAADNAQANARRSPTGGPYGPDTCLNGYVWRDAWVGDHVCVTPATRSQAAADNAAGPSRRALDTYTQALKIGDGAGVYGDAKLDLNPNGAYTFHVHLNNSNLANRDTATACVVKLLNNKVLTFSVKGNLYGTGRIFESQKRDWDPRGVSASVANEWAAIPRSMPITCRVSTSINAGMLTKQIVQGLGYAYTAYNAIAVVAA